MNSERYTCIFGKSSEIQSDIMNQVHYERKRCLVDKLGWDLRVCDGLEFDQFDRSDTEYLIVMHDGFHACSLRIHCNPANKSLLSAISPHDVSVTDSIWEISRFISSNFSFSTSEYILFTAIHYALRDNNSSHAYTTLSKSIARMYKMFGMTITLANNLNEVGSDYLNYRIDTSHEALQRFIQKAPDRDRAYLQLLGEKWENLRAIKRCQPHYARIARPKFIGTLKYEEITM